MYSRASRDGRGGDEEIIQKCLFAGPPRPAGGMPRGPRGPRGRAGIDGRMAGGMAHARRAGNAPGRCALVRSRSRDGAMRISYICISDPIVRSKGKTSARPPAPGPAAAIHTSAEEPPGSGKLRAYGGVFQSAHTRKPQRRLGGGAVHTNALHNVACAAGRKMAATSSSEWLQLPQVCLVLALAALAAARGCRP
jgi:hypothetical protein